MIQPAEPTKSDLKEFSDPGKFPGRVEYTPRGRWLRWAGDEGRTYYREYESRARFAGMPLVHFTAGTHPTTGKSRAAIGWIAIGQYAYGGLAIGQFAVGLVSVGQFSLSLLAGVGQFTTGMIAIGQVAVGGLIGVGQLASGVFAIGQFAIGWKALGAVPISLGPAATAPAGSAVAVPPAALAN